MSKILIILFVAILVVSCNPTPSDAVIARSAPEESTQSATPSQAIAIAHGISDNLFTTNDDTLSFGVAQLGMQGEYSTTITFKDFKAEYNGTIVTLSGTGSLAFTVDSASSNVTKVEIAISTDDNLQGTNSDSDTYSVTGEISFRPTGVTFTNNDFIVAGKYDAGTLDYTIHYGSVSSSAMSLS